MRTKIEYTGTLTKIQDLFIDINNPPSMKIGEFYYGTFFKVPELGTPFRIKFGEGKSFELKEIKKLKKVNSWEWLLVSETTVYRLIVSIKTRHYTFENPFAQIVNKPGTRKQVPTKKYRRIIKPAA